MSDSTHGRLAVCSWSLQPETPEALLHHLQDIGIPRVQIALDPIRENPSVWGKYVALCEKQGVSNVSGMMVTVGEDYTTMETIKETGGVVLLMLPGLRTSSISKTISKSPKIWGLSW